MSSEPIVTTVRSRGHLIALVAAVSAFSCGLAGLWWGVPALLVLLVPLALAAAAWLTRLALLRFEVFVLGLLLVRPSLDRLPAAGPLDPSSLLALLFIATSLVWLGRRARTRPLHPSAVTLALAAFAGAALISCLVSPLPLVSAVAASKTVAGVLMFAVVEQLLRERPERVRGLVAVVLASAVVPCAVALQQFVGAGATFVDASLGLSRVVGTFLHPNPFATYVTMVLLLAVAVLPHLRWRQRLLVLALLPLLGLALVGTFARGGWIATALGLAYLLGKRSKLLLAAAGIVVVFVGTSVAAVRERFADLGAAPPVPGVPANSVEWRLGYWQDVLQYAERNPVTGIGLEVVQNTADDQLPPHNAFVQAYVETGLLGLVALLAVIVTLAVALHRRVRAAEPGPERSLALVAAAIGLGLLAQTLTENLLTQTMALWYFAAAGTIGLPLRRDRADIGAAAGETVDQTVVDPAPARTG